MFTKKIAGNKAISTAVPHSDSGFWHEYSLLQEQKNALYFLVHILQATSFASSII